MVAEGMFYLSIFVSQGMKSVEGVGTRVHAGGLGAADVWSPAGCWELFYLSIFVTHPMVLKGRWRWLTGGFGVADVWSLVKHVLLVHFRHSMF